jgi:hypothetical protein
VEGKTALHNFPYPGEGDAPDVAANLKTIMTEIDGVITVHKSGTFSARPTPATLGIVYWATDTEQVFLDTGSSWVTLAGPVSIVGASLGSATVRLETGSKQSFVTWGNVESTGTVKGSSEDFTVAQPKEGEYKVTFAKGKGTAEYAPIIQLMGIQAAENFTEVITRTGEEFVFKTMKGASAKSMAFCFSVYAHA